MPFFIPLPKGVAVVRDYLEQGDYSICGYEHEICVERKNPDDFLTSITSDSKRFKQRLTEMESWKVKIIVVEKQLSEILKMCDPHVKKAPRMIKGKVRLRATSNKRKIHPNVVLGTVYSIFGKYQVPIFFAIDRSQAEEFTLGVLRKYYQITNP